MNNEDDEDKNNRETSSIYEPRLFLIATATMVSALDVEDEEGM